ncbi:MAG: hypothetical protein KA758_05970 [Acidimicrobiales bacterium]|nr:hypothetical protein [Acidimicrobiales bacterium]
MAVLAVAATPGAAGSVAELTGLVGRGHRIVAWHHHVRPVRGRRPDAVVAADVAVLADLGDSSADLGAPVACRVTSGEDLSLARSWGVTVSFTSEPSLRPSFTGPVVWIPPDGIDLTPLPVLPLLTRARLRLAHGLPEPLVLAVDATAPPADRSTSLALASAAVVDGPLVPLALALGTPSVITPEVADRFGLEADWEVVVADDTRSADRLAAALARDDERAAALARRARRFAEEHLDLGPAVTDLRRRLGLEESPSLIDLRLDELATPASSRLRTRADRALSLFTLEPMP